jgi:hypothetical protein
MNKRMAAIIKMLSSKHEAEVISAARALGAELTRNGKDWNDLGSYLASWDGMARAEPAPPPKRPKTQTYSGGNAPSWTRRARDPDPVDKDRDFVEGLIDRFDTYAERTFISPAQRDWVNNLYHNFVENKRRRR